MDVATESNEVIRIRIADCNVFQCAHNHETMASFYSKSNMFMKATLAAPSTLFGQIAYKKYLENLNEFKYLFTNSACRITKY